MWDRLLEDVLLDCRFSWIIKGNCGFSGQDVFYGSIRDEVYSKQGDQENDFRARRGDPLVTKLMLSGTLPRKRQSLDGEEFERPPRPRQGFLDLDQLFMREITVEWRQEKPDSLCLKDHPPQRRSTAIHSFVLDVSAPTEYEISPTVSASLRNNTLTCLSASLQTILPVSEVAVGWASC